MQQFTQKYAVIQLCEDMSVGTEFSMNNWPLHVTIADTFAIDWDAPMMIQNLTVLAKSCAQVVADVEGDRFFGDNGQTQVVLIKKTDDLVKLHDDVIGLLERGGWEPNDPRFAKKGFLPHSTVQSHGRLDKGDKITFNALSVIDFFPGKDPYRRKLLATIKIGT